MISKVTLEAATWAELPHKFEAGTPNIRRLDRVGHRRGLPDRARHGQDSRV